MVQNSDSRSSSNPGWRPNRVVPLQQTSTAGRPILPGLAPNLSLASSRAELPRNAALMPRKPVGPPVYRPNLALESRPAPSAYRPLSGERPAPKRQFTQGALQGMNATAGRGTGASQPAAQPQTRQRLQGPPVYHPALAVEARPAPSVYRPFSGEMPPRSSQFPRGALQRMNATTGRGTGASQPAAQSQTRPRLLGPPVYRPQNPAALQRKTAGPPAYRPNLGLEPRPAPPVYRPGSGTGTLLPKATASKIAAPRMPDSGMRGSKKLEVIQWSIAPAPQFPAAALPSAGRAALTRVVQRSGYSLFGGPDPRAQLGLLNVFDLESVPRGGPVVPAPLIAPALTIEETVDQLIADLERQRQEDELDRLLTELEEEAEARAELDQLIADLERQRQEEEGVTIPPANASSGILMPPNVIPPPPTPPLGRMRTRTLPPISESDDESEVEAESEFEPEFEPEFESESEPESESEFEGPVVRRKPKFPRRLRAEIVGGPVENLVTAASPGIYTGPFSLLDVAGSLASFPFGPNPANVPTPIGYAASPSSFASGLGDIVGIARASYTIDQARKVLRNPHATRAEKELARRQLKSAGADLGTELLDVGGQITNLAGTFTGVTAVSGAASFASVPVSGVVAGRAIWRAGRAGKHQRKLEQALRSIPRTAEYSDLRDALKFARRQMIRRQVRQGFGAAGALLSVGGGIALGVGAVATTAALMATPVGWGLAAAGGAVALTVGAYKGIRYIHKRRTGRKGGKRSSHADKLILALSDPRISDNVKRSVREALSLKTQKLTGGKQLLEEKLSSW
jgi:hypothetical protein